MIATWEKRAPGVVILLTGNCNGERNCTGSNDTMYSRWVLHHGVVMMRSRREMKSGDEQTNKTEWRARNDKMNLREMRTEIRGLRIHPRAVVCGDELTDELQKENVQYPR